MSINCCYPITPPAPRNVCAVAVNDSSIQVTWDAVNGASAYRIYRSLSPDGIYEEAGTSGQTKVLDTGLSPSTTYYYRVLAVVNGTPGELSEPVSATTLCPAPKIAVPENLRACPQGTCSIRVSWCPVAMAGGYYVYRSCQPEGPYEQIAVVKETSFLDGILWADTTYCYKVAAFLCNITGDTAGPVCTGTEASVAPPSCCKCPCCCSRCDCRANFEK